MKINWLVLLTLVALATPTAAHAQVLEITRELGAPQHYYVNDPFTTATGDAVPFPAAPDFQFAISDYSTVRLRLVAPAGKKYVSTQAVYIDWVDIRLAPVGGGGSGEGVVCPASWSINTLAGTEPMSTIEGFEFELDQLMIRSTATGMSSADFEFTEIVMEWDVSSLSGTSHLYTITDSGGWAAGPEMIAWRPIARGAPDPGQALFLEDLAPRGVLEITRELGAPQHFYDNGTFLTTAQDAVPFPAAPNVEFAIDDYSTVRLRLVAPAGKKYVATRASYFTWPSDIRLSPVGGGSTSGVDCPVSWSINTLAGTAPTSTVAGFKYTLDWLTIRSYPTGMSSADFEFTEIVLEWDVSAFSGTSHLYTITDDGGYIAGPELNLFRVLELGAPDTGQAIYLVDIAPREVFEITRELGEPQHYYDNIPLVWTVAGDAVPFPAAPDFQFAISDCSTVRLRLVAPAGKKYVATQAVQLSWPHNFYLAPVGGRTGSSVFCPASWSFNTLAGTAPTSTIRGYKAPLDWLSISSTPTGTSSADFEFTEIVLEWNVSAFTGASHLYTISDSGGWIIGPELNLYRNLALGAPDPGPAIFLQDIGSPSDVSAELPSAHRLSANVPNPFNPSTMIYYEIPSAGQVQLEILDLRGRLVRTLVSGRVEAGRHATAWHGVGDDGRRVASGVYLYRLRSGSFVETRSMVLLK